MALQTYRAKRDFKKTREPRGKRPARSRGDHFVIQKHDASHLHYDLRLEVDGVLKSWAVPKGPSLDPQNKRLAIEVEDHPLEYAKFEGEIPRGEYGAGEVIVWDRGTWKCYGDPHVGLKKGRLHFELHGEKLEGEWALVRTRGSASGAASKPQWLFMKIEDENAVPESSYDVTEAKESVVSGKVLTRDRSERNAQEPPVAEKDRTEPERRVPIAVRIPEPQFAQLVTEPPRGKEWVHEIKFDGYRTLCLVQGDRVKFFTRSGLDWTEKYSALIPFIRKLGLRDVILDGEIVRLDDRGRSDFGLLQRALTLSHSQELTYFVFDLLRLDGEDWRDRTLADRKKKLRSLFGRKKSGSVRFSDHLTGDGKKVLAECCELGLEGIVSKNLRAEYSSGRGMNWLKSKCVHGQEFVIVGYSPPGGARHGFGALLLGARDSKGEFRYVGRVGTGFGDEDLRDLSGRFRKLATTHRPFAEKVAEEKHVKWVRPELVAEVHFRGWTEDGLLRQAAFQGLRLDKVAEEVTIDRARRPSKTGEKSRKKRTGSTRKTAKAVALTNPDKLLIRKAGLTKKGLLSYLEAVSKWILPYVKDRPLALVRCPDGIEKGCFFQKNRTPGAEAALHSQTIEDPKGKSANLIYIEDVEGLRALAQMGVLEIHVWGTHRKNYLSPDTIVFDLDPGDDVPDEAVVEAALRLKDLLDRQKLKSFLKVSGGKGYHVHVPIAPRYTWDQVKAFAQAVSLQMVHENPGRYVATMTKAKRKGKIFIDFFRNTYGATSVAPYSPRAKEGATVAFPIAWKDIRRSSPSGFTLDRAIRILKKRANDPWKGYAKLKQEIGILKTLH